MRKSGQIMILDGVEVREYWEKFRRLPYISIGLVIANVLIFLLNLVQEDAWLWSGCLDVYSIGVNREYGRVICSMFLHADVNHLFNNMIVLLFMGNMLEKETGHAAFGFIYFLSGICGNICSLIYKVISGSMAVSIGASGAVFGMDGLLLALVLLSGRKLSTVTPSRVIIMVVLSLYNGFAADNIDNAAHVGGLFAGFILGCFLCVFQHIKHKLKK